MIVTVYKGGSYGIRVGLPNVRTYFNRHWKNIRVRIGGTFHSFPLTKTFWTSCPEFRGVVIRQWLLRRGKSKWPKGRPPKFTLLRLGKKRFRLR